MDKRVYRSQGWISPVVLQAGRIIGVWFPKKGRGQAALEVSLFRRVSPSVRRAVEGEVEALGRFMDERYDVRFVSS